MADRALYTKEAAYAKADVVKASLATSKLRMFKFGEVVINAATTRAQLLEAECDFDGYTTGGYTIAAFTGPADGDTGGAAISTPLITATFGPASDPIVANDVGGYWIEDASDPDPLVREVVVFDPKKTMGAVGNQIQVLNTITEGLNTLVPSE